MTAASEARKRDAIVVALCQRWPGIAVEHDIAEQAVAGLEADGWVIQRRETVRRTQERIRLAEHRVRVAQDDAERSERWARECLDVERRMRDRCTFLYGAARAHGATVEELGGTPG